MAEQEVVFLQGLTQRTGTVFLNNLLTAHPDCEGIMSLGLGEDYVLHYLKDLKRYVNSVHETWNKDWEFDPNLKSDLASRLGTAVCDFLSQKSDAPFFVSKSPDVFDITAFWDFFPNKKLIIIIRDGRSTVASLVKGFGFGIERASIQWAQAAEVLIRMKQIAAEKNPDLLKIVRFENLIGDYEPTLRDLFDFIGLDPKAFDYAKAEQGPVHGSSFQKKEGEALTWEAKEKTKDFNPLKRFDSLSKADRERIDWILGKQQELLGYVRDEIDRNAAYTVKQNARDLIGSLRGMRRRLRSPFK